MVDGKKKSAPNDFSQQRNIFLTQHVVKRSLASRTARFYCRHGEWAIMSAHCICKWKRNGDTRTACHCATKATRRRNQPKATADQRSQRTTHFLSFTRRNVVLYWHTLHMQTGISCDCLSFSSHTFCGFFLFVTAARGLGSPTLFPLLVCWFHVTAAFLWVG